MVQYVSLIRVMGVRISLSDYMLQVAVPYACGQPNVFAA